jgi:hypothetical protein
MMRLCVCTVGGKIDGYGIDLLAQFLINGIDLFAELLVEVRGAGQTFGYPGSPGNNLLNPRST